jgi:FAD/FMN-containing dehydrogenase
MLSPGRLSAVCERVDQTPGLNIILFEPLSGLARRIDPGTAAFPAREARWNVTGRGVWSDAEHDEAQVAWARGVSQSLAPWSLLGGGYLNCSAHDEPVGRIESMFGPERWARLRQLKRRYDPGDVLCHNANIAP